MTNLVGRTLGLYKLESQLGKGGMALVYRAFQTSVKRTVAIKVMAPEIASEPGFVERFTREAEVIAALEHPHILPVIDYGEADGLHYMVMRFIEGGSLDDRMRQRPLTPEETANFMTQIASALDYAHKRGVIHRDLKPNNVLLDNDNNCYLTDFGIARLAGTERKLTSTGTVMGTPAYMSPEQAMGRPVDARSDIYTLGVMMYEMVLSKLPFAADTPAALIFQHVYELPTPPKQVRPDLSDAIAAVLDRALQKSPDARYQTATELANDYAEAAGIRLSTPRRSAPTAPPPGDYERTVNLSTPTGAPSRRQPTPMAAERGERTYVEGAGSPDRAAQGVAAGRRDAASQRGTVAQPEPKRRSPVGLIVGAVAVLAVAAAGGAFAIISNNNNNATATAQAVAAIETSTQVAHLNQTATQQAILVLSYTPTFTSTPTSTDTPTATFTPSATPTNTPTNTPTATPTMDVIGTQNALNATGTQLAIEAQVTAAAATVEALNALGTAIAATSTARVLNVQATNDAVATRQRLNEFRTATAQARNNQRATFDAQKTELAQSVTDVPPTPVATRTPRASPTSEPDGVVLPDLMSGNPTVIIRALREAGIIPDDANVTEAGIVSNREKANLRGQTNEQNVFIRLPLSPASFDNVVISTTVTIRSSTAGLDKTGCGLFFNGTVRGTETPDMVAIVMTRAQGYTAWARKDGAWLDSPFARSTSSAIKGGNDDENVLTMVNIDGNVKLFINGVLTVDATERTHRRGTVGYYHVKGVEGDAEGCQFDNTSLWRVS